MSHDDVFKELQPDFEKIKKELIVVSKVTTKLLEHDKNFADLSITLAVMKNYNETQENMMQMMHLFDFLSAPKEVEEARLRPTLNTNQRKILAVKIYKQLLQEEGDDTVSEEEILKMFGGKEEE